MKTPSEISTTLDELMRFEYLAQVGTLLPKRNIYSILAGQHAAKMRGRGLDFEEVRQYVPGDDIRNIDWKVTARTTDTYSKIFNEEKERRSFILLDQSASMFFGSKLFVKSVTAAHVAALSAFYTVKRGDRVGGLVFNDEGSDYIEPKRSKALVQHFLQLIAERNNALLSRKRTQSKPELFNQMLERTRLSITHDFVILIISDLTKINAESKQHLRSMAAHNDVILVHIEDPMDKTLPAGKLLLSDGNRQIGWSNDQNNWGEKYANDYQQWLVDLKDEFRHYKIPVSVICTDKPVEEQIKERVGTTLKNKQ